MCPAEILKGSSEIKVMLLFPNSADIVWADAPNSALPNDSAAFCYRPDNLIVVDNWFEELKAKPRK